ncbi:XRE family transcriptional regulator, partial [Streptomyces sp. WAC05292]|uniref:helix-turn-helix domain-containing protein n=1 Tax=Streptomyces sp. WAC05292 TaxID=2487418 RepID=UPI000FBACF72
MTESTGEPAGLPSPEDRRRLREAADLTCEQVAERLGVSGAAVRSWEAGRTHPRGRKRAAYVRLLARGADGSGGGSDPGPRRCETPAAPARGPPPPAPGRAPPRPHVRAAAPRAPRRAARRARAAGPPAAPPPPRPPPRPPRRH